MSYLKSIILSACLVSTTAHAATDSLENALMGGAVGTAAATLTKHSVPLGAGLGAALGYLFNQQNGDESLEEYFINSGVHIVDDSRGTHLVLPSDQMFKKPTDSVIDARYYNILNRVVELLKMYPGVALEISGHTDNLLNPTDRILHSMNQAQSVSDYLLARGVEGNQIIAVHGDGDLKPIMKNTSITARRANRRVEISFLYRRSAPTNQYVQKPSDRTVANVGQHPNGMPSFHVPTATNHSHPGVDGEVELPDFGM